MAEVEITIIEEVKCLKNEIKALRKELKKPNASKEELLTFKMLGRHKHIINQQAWRGGGNTSMPYTRSQIAYPPGW